MWSRSRTGGRRRHPPAQAGVRDAATPGPPTHRLSFHSLPPSLSRRVKWTDGVTQGGSSGSALIDASTGAVVGVLSGGSSVCGAADELRADYFGRIDAAWDAGMWQFFSDGPADVASEDALQAATQVAAASGINAEPTTFLLSAAAPAVVLTTWWGDPLPAGGSASVRVSYEVLPGLSPGSASAGASSAAAAGFEVGPAELVFLAKGVRMPGGDGVQNSQALNVSLGAPEAGVGLCFCC